MKTPRILIAAVAQMALTGAAHAAAVFQGRLADGTASSTCTVSGATKCTSFYESNLDLTILNNWNIGKGSWSASAVDGSAQALAESAGFAATGLTGWTLPTGNGTSVAGGPDQFLSIWMDAYYDSLGGLQAQFEGVQTGRYWSSTLYGDYPSNAWYLWIYVMPNGIYTAIPLTTNQNDQLYTVAVRPGDVAAFVPEPQTLALALLALGAAVVARRRRPA
jgi:MYXO-CTERM domain-containing protein